MATTKTLATWLSRIEKPESWLDPKLNELSSQELILDRDVVIKRIVKAIQSGESIAVYGDYDLDGTGSAVILTDCIRQCGGRVTTIIASRFDGGGYGFNDVACSKVIAMKASLLITADCGSSDHARFERLLLLGIEALVLDHHLVPSVPLPKSVLGFLNPHRENCRSEYKWMCSGGLSLSVCGGVLRELGIPRSKIDPLQWLEICALATIGDVAPLTGDNRILTRLGLNAISNSKLPGIQALMEINKIPMGTKMTARDVAFRIAPALNAPGRLGPPDIIVDLLLSKDIDEARKIAATVKEIWDRRRTITEEITEKCFAMIAEQGLDQHPAIVVGDPDFGHGIVGIVAARVVDKYKKPVCVIGHEGRGSLRGPAGVKLYEALKYCQTYLNKWGGHNAAAGCQLDFSQLPAFRAAFSDYFANNAADQVPEKAAVDTTLILDPSDNLMDLCLDLAKLEPCGQGNPRPTVQVTGTVDSAKEVKGGHLKLDVRLGPGRKLSCFAIAKGDLVDELEPGTKVVLTGDLRKNVWKGRESAEMFVETLVSG